VKTFHSKDRITETELSESIWNRIASLWFGSDSVPGPDGRPAGRNWPTHHFLQHGCGHQHERDVVQVARRLHHRVHPETARPDDQPGHGEGACLCSVRVRTVAASVLRQSSWVGLPSVCVQVSKISLVDLAGSERADSSGAKGTRLKVRGHTRAAAVLCHFSTVNSCVEAAHLWLVLFCSCRKERT